MPAGMRTDHVSLSARLERSRSASCARNRKSTSSRPRRMSSSSRRSAATERAIATSQTATRSRSGPTSGACSWQRPRAGSALNGLNLDGNASPTNSEDGLRVTAGKFVLSNETIAVNKGHILLRGGTGQANHGVYLGGSVFSRGWDSVGADGVRGGGDDVKTGYRIAIEGANLGLFDNTREFASIPRFACSDSDRRRNCCLHRLTGCWWPVRGLAEPVQARHSNEWLVRQLHRVLFGQWTSI